MDYREHAPWPALADFVSRVWTLTGHAHEMDGTPQAVLPDGHPELVVHFGDAFERVEGVRAERQPAVLFAGQLTAQLTLRPTGRIAVFGVRFRPYGAAPLVGIPQRELTGFTIDVAQLDRKLASSLQRVLSATDDPVTASALVQRTLCSRLRASRVDGRVQTAVAAIMRTRGTLDMDTVARHSAMTRRHLERRFLDEVGITPKRLARIARFQHALQVLEAADSPRRGTDTALDCGYADQSHFIRDFRELAGCSPSEHLLQQASLTRFFIMDSDDSVPQCRLPSHLI